MLLAKFAENGTFNPSSFGMETLWKRFLLIVSSCKLQAASFKTEGLSYKVKLVVLNK